MSNDKSADLRARRWCPHAIGLGNLGVGVEYILEAAPHKVGDVSPVRVCVTLWGKHVAVVTNWLLLLNVIVS